MAEYFSEYPRFNDLNLAGGIITIVAVKIVPGGPVGGCPEFFTDIVNEPLKCLVRRVGVFQTEIPCEFEYMMSEECPTLMLGSPDTGDLPAPYMFASACRGVAEQRNKGRRVGGVTVIIVYDADVGDGLQI